MSAGKNDTAYNEGFTAGHTDRLLGARSDYAWYQRSRNEWVRAYSRGYRDGWLA